MILLLQPIFDTLKGAQSKGGVFAGLPFGEYLPRTDAIDLRMVAVLLVGLTLAKGVAEYFSSYFMSRIGQSVIADVRSSLYDHITRQAAPFFSKHPTNELTAHLMSDAAMVERSVSDTLRGPPDRMMPTGSRFEISATGVCGGRISEYTDSSRRRRAISCVYCEPKSSTTIV